MNIRTAQLSEFSDIKRLCQSLFEYERSSGLDDHVTNMRWTETEFAQRYFTEAIASQNGRQAFVAEADGRVVGYLIGSTSTKLFLAHNPLAELDNMLVEEAHRGTGAGTKLVVAFKEWAKSQGATRVRVGHYAANHQAHAFYRKNGFIDHEVYLEQSI